MTTHGIVLHDGMIYLGPWLPAVSFGGPDPALIDPRLPVAGPPDRQGSAMQHWSSYSAIPPTSRAAYLEWLADGRRDPGVYLGYVFLFLYGLERRVLVECLTPGPARSDLPAVRAELERLLSIYGRNAAFRRHALGIRDVIDISSGRRPTMPPVRTSERWPAPIALRHGLGIFAAGNAPIPADWALAWLWFHPEIYTRTPARNCMPEFERIFTLRYRDRFGGGMRVSSTERTVQLEYEPASAGLPFLRLDLQLPDIFHVTRPVQELAALADECTEMLASYSRWLARHPGDRGRLPAETLLPPALVDTENGPAADLLGWADTCLATDDTAVVRAGELTAFWPTEDRESSKREAILLAKLLGDHGFGIEPDPRITGRTPTDGPVVLFRSDGEPTAAASSVYSAASALLHLAVVVSRADGDLADTERQHLVEHLESGLELNSAERARLRAHLQWLLVSPSGLDAVRGRVADLSTAQRSQIGDFLVTVAAADGSISVEETRILIRIYRLLGLDPDLVHRVVADALPPSSVSGPGTVSSPDAASVRPRLDPAVIARKIAETDEVSSLLATIFVDDEPAPLPVATEPSVDAIPGLDLPHSGLLRALAGKSQWSRVEFETVTAAWGVLPDGALDTINDAAFEMAGDPVLEGDDPIEINTEVLGEMLR